MQRWIVDHFFFTIIVISSIVTTNLYKNNKELVKTLSSRIKKSGDTVRGQPGMGGKKPLELQDQSAGRQSENEVELQNLCSRVNKVVCLLPKKRLYKTYNIKPGLRR